MESYPSRAKRRISSRPSQGFFSRFRRSTLCVFVSWSALAIKKKNPPPAFSGDGFGICRGGYPLDSPDHNRLWFGCAARRHESPPIITLSLLPGLLCILGP